jgi:hypothetical protein
VSLARTLATAIMNAAEGYAVAFAPMLLVVILARFPRH